MILAKVVGTVWAARKDRRLASHKLMLVRPYSLYNPTHPVEQLVAVDTVDAGPGDDVVVCLGSPARWTSGGANLPVDAAIMGVVDRCQLQRSAFDAGARRPARFLGGEPPAGTEWV